LFTTVKWSLQLLLLLVQVKLGAVDVKHGTGTANTSLVRVHGSIGDLVYNVFMNYSYH
jgi:hypothetical protein